MSVPTQADLARTKTNMDGFNAAMQSDDPDATFPDANGGVFKSKGAIEAVGTEQAERAEAAAAEAEQSAGLEGSVNTYALLPAAAGHNGELYQVLNDETRGNRRAIYSSNGSVWSFVRYGAIGTDSFIETEFADDVIALASKLDNEGIRRLCVWLNTEGKLEAFGIGAALYAAIEAGLGTGLNIYPAAANVYAVTDTDAEGVRRAVWLNADGEQVFPTGGTLVHLQVGDYDIWLVIGQSNAEGRGTQATQTVVPAGVAFFFNGSGLDDLSVLQTLGTPIGGADTGCAWPAFAKKWFERTGRRSIFVEAATGGSAMQAAADNGSGNWDAGGTLYGASITALDACTAYLDGIGATYVVRSALMALGERDAQGIDGAEAGVTKAGYISAANNMFARFRTDIGNSFRLAIFQTGMLSTSSGTVPADTTGFQQIRAAQNELAMQNRDVIMVYQGAVTFPSRGMMKADGIHNAQTGLNEMGETGACSLANHLPSLLSAYQE